MGIPSMPELIIILTIVILLFGAKRIPDLAKSVGKSIKGFRSEMKEDEVAEDDQKIEKCEETAPIKKDEETKKV
ncbi:MAG: twin-arginine translocase TatA/TatE family subunit [Sulfurospirillum sp.]|nr:twin-arginine translocase TatA/TatE family subunit [Sulfurospirillum sp.]